MIRQEEGGKFCIASGWVTFYILDVSLASLEFFHLTFYLFSAEESGNEGAGTSRQKRIASGSEKSFSVLLDAQIQDPNRVLVQILGQNRGPDSVPNFALLADRHVLLRSVNFPTILREPLDRHVPDQNPAHVRVLPSFLSLITKIIYFIL